MLKACSASRGAGARSASHGPAEVGRSRIEVGPPPRSGTGAAAGLGRSAPVKLSSAPPALHGLVLHWLCTGSARAYPSSARAYPRVCAPEY
eukprot:scaffold46298_cov62-Phaeocystis_antarctica.AAC.1